MFDRTSSLTVLLTGLIALLLVLPSSGTGQEPPPEGALADAREAADLRAFSNALLATAELGSVFGSDAITVAPRTTVAKPGVRVSLLADRPELIPGKTARVAVRMRMDEGWHTYYGPNTGAFSLPIEVEWQVPDGYEISEIVWPAPHRYKEPTGDISYVYEGDLVLDVELTVPEDATLGGQAEIGARVRYQVCETNCITGSAELSLPLAVVAAPTRPAEPRWLEPFRLADKRQPLSEEDGYDISSTVSHSPLRVGDTIVGVVNVAPPDGTTLDDPDDEHPLIIFERIKGLKPETVQVNSLADGGKQIVLRIAATEELEQDGDLVWEALVQARADNDGDTQPVAVLASLALTLGDAEAEVAAIESELLADVDVDALLADGADGPREVQGPTQADIPIWQALLFAFLGGLILNIMPCVLPVLSLKALALVEEANESQHRVQSFVGMYVLGVLFSFWALAAVIIGLKYSGEFVGWGFQFQEPAYVLVMSGVIFAFALSLFGVFEIPGLTTQGTDSGGLKGSFVHGILTTALSTPCSAPLLGSALAFALSQSPTMILATFTLVGFGLAAPVALLTINPKMRRFIPRPGPWMETFKHVVAFLLVGTVIWLLGVLTAQLSSDGMTTVFVMLGAISVAAWILGRWTGPLAPRRSKVLATAGAVLAIAAGVFFLNLEQPDGSGESLESDRIAWQKFEGEDTLALAAEGNTVFIDFTADWCATCKANESTAIETDSVAQLIRDHDIIPVKADLTRRDPELTKWVEYYGRAAIPLYVILPAGEPDNPILLPEVITEDMLLDSLREAGPSKATADNDVESAEL